MMRTVEISPLRSAALEVRQPILLTLRQEGLALSQAKGLSAQAKLNLGGGLGTEIKWSAVSKRSGIPVQKLKELEKTSTTLRQRRVAEFNWELLRRASALNGPTDIALTFVDYLSPENEKARRFEQLEKDTINFIEEIQRVAAAPVSLISTRFGFRSIIDRRAW